VWTLKSFVIDDGADVLETWYALYSADQFVKLRAKFYTIMLYLRQQPKPPNWVGPYFHFLKNSEGVGAINFEWKNIQYRPLGFFGPRNMEFTFLYFASENGDKYQPEGCIQTAVDRMNVVKLNAARAVKSTRW